MERLVVEADGKVVIPPQVIRAGGLQPGDKISVFSTDQGFLVRYGDAEVWEWAQAWWDSLSEDDKKIARVEAEWYESLSETERDALWGQFPESIDEAAEGDEIEITAISGAAR